MLYRNYPIFFLRYEAFTLKLALSSASLHWNITSPKWSSPLSSTAAGSQESSVVAVEFTNVPCLFYR